MKRYLYGIYLIVFFFLCAGFAPSRPRGISYVPDFNLADQGAAVGLSVKNIIDATDPNRQITINLTQASGYLDENTPYNVSTNLIIPSNVTLVVESGAYLTGSATLTINGPFEGSPGCFSATIGSNITFGDNTIDKINVLWFAELSDAFSCSNNSEISLYFPYTSTGHYITSELTSNYGMIGENTILYIDANGSIVFDAGDENTYILFENFVIDSNSLVNAEMIEIKRRRVRGRSLQFIGDPNQGQIGVLFSLEDGEGITFCDFDNFIFRFVDYPFKVYGDPNYTAWFNANTIGKTLGGNYIQWFKEAFWFATNLSMTRNNFAAYLEHGTNACRIEAANFVYNKFEFECDNVDYLRCLLKNQWNAGIGNDYYLARNNVHSAAIVLADPNDEDSIDYDWTLSGSGTDEYYLTDPNGNDPGLTSEPLNLYYGTTEAVNNRASIMTCGSLSNHRWDWCDNDSLGFNTIYYRSGEGDPDDPNNGVYVNVFSRFYRNPSSTGYFHYDRFYNGSATTWSRLSGDVMYLNPTGNGQGGYVGIKVNAETSDTAIELGSDTMHSDFDETWRDAGWLSLKYKNKLLFYDSTNAEITFEIDGDSCNLNRNIAVKTINYGSDTATDDDYIITTTPTFVTYTKGTHYYFDANNANVGVCTANFNSIGAKSIKIKHDQDPNDNCIELGMMVDLMYDGTNFQMMNPCAN